MSTDERNRIIEKVKLLLNQTEERGCTEHEAMTAFGIAARLAAKVGLELKDIQAETEAEKPTADYRPFGTEYKGISKYDLEIFLVLCSLFRCEPVMSGNLKYGLLRAVGMPEDLDMLQITYNFVLSFFNRESKKVVKRANENAYDWEKGKEFSSRVKRSYHAGFLEGLKNSMLGALEEEAKKMNEQIEGGQCTALSLIEKHPAVKDKLDEVVNSSKKKHFNPLDNFDIDSNYLQGYSDGATMQVNALEGE